MGTIPRMKSSMVTPHSIMRLLQQRSHSCWKLSCPPPCSISIGNASRHRAEPCGDVTYPGGAVMHVPWPPPLRDCGILFAGLILSSIRPHILIYGFCKRGWMIGKLSTHERSPSPSRYRWSEPFDPSRDGRAAVPNMYRSREWEAMGIMTDREINLIVYSKFPRRRWNEVNLGRGKE